MLETIVSALLKINSAFSAPFKIMLAVWVALYIFRKGWSYTLIESAFWFCSAFIVLHILEWIGKKFLAWRHLQRLSIDERNVFVSFMTTGIRTRGFTANTPTAIAMTKVGILERCELPPDHPRGGVRGWAHFTIPQWVFRYLQKHPHCWMLGP